MSGFSAEWLDLREPFDAAARAADLVVALPPRRARAPLDVVDLGAGTGANLRYLAPLLGGAQRWTLVDADPVLLDLSLGATARWAGERGARIELGHTTLFIGGREFECEIRRAELDLARDLARLDLPTGSLVTSSALLDLVGDGWLGALAERCRAAGASALFALNYDGRTTCSPAERDDGAMLELLNRHQRTDKGFGAALGPEAARAARATFERLGYRVSERASDWRVGPRDIELQRALIDGWGNAAAEIAPERHAEVVDWARRRHAHVAQARSAIVVGHVDLLCLPASE
jgi:SAM-dependent methyltransferase